MTKESRNVAKPVRLVPMDRVVVRLEALLVRVRPDHVELAEPLAHLFPSSVVASRRGGKERTSP